MRSLAALVLSFVSIAHAAPPARLLFWSGFEGEVAIGAPHKCYASGCFQDVRGNDAVTGFRWPPKFATRAVFQARSGTPSDPATITDYIVNEIQTVTGRSGAPTRAQFSLIKQNPCTGTAGQRGCSTQSAFLLRPAAEPEELYISFWRKLQPDLLEKFERTNAWHVVFEWKTAGDYRVIAQIMDRGGAPFWRVRGDNDANGGLPKAEFWRVENRTVRVPIGVWFKFEVFWRRSDAADGRVWMAVNGQKIADRYGPNVGALGAPIDRIMFLQLYSGAAYPVYQWTDDVQIWSGFPDARPGQPWYDGVYGPR